MSTTKNLKNILKKLVDAYDNNDDAKGFFTVALEIIQKKKSFGVFGIHDSNHFPPLMI